MNAKHELYNFKTQQHDIGMDKLSTDEEALQHMPQIEPMKSLYSVYRELGLTVKEAFLKCLQAMLTPPSDETNESEAE